MNSWDSIVRALREKDEFLIISHINPDGDSLGSSLGLACGLRKLGKEVKIMSNDTIPELYNFLNFEQFILSKPDPQEWNVVVLDCSGLDRTGSAAELIQKCNFCINIDHHPTNESFGDLNYTDDSAAAVGQIIYELLQELSIEFDSEIASALYMALLTDTGGFRYANTDSKCLTAAGSLVNKGADPKAIAEKIYQQTSYNSLQLLSQTLAAIKTDCAGQIVWTYINQEMLQATKCRMEDAEDTVSYLLSLKDVKLIAIFKEKEQNYIRVSLRSKVDLDISLIAQKYAGGGHSKAAGCTIRASLAEAEKIIVAELRELVKNR